MGCDYCISAQLRVKDTSEVTALYDKLHELAYGDIEVSKDAGTNCLVIDIEGHEYTSYGTASNIDDTVKAFGPYMLSAAKVKAKYDDEDDSYWVGTKQQVAAAESDECVTDAVRAYKMLSDDERVKFYGEIQAWLPRKGSC